MFHDKSTILVRNQPNVVICRSANCCAMRISLEASRRPFWTNTVHKIKYARRTSRYMFVGLGERRRDGAPMVETLAGGQS